AAGGEPIATAVSLAGGQWQARARVSLPAYGYRLLGLVSTEQIEPSAWTPGSEVCLGTRSVSLKDRVLTVTEDEKQLTVSVPPFRLSDPSGVAGTEEVTPSWAGAHT